jgi:hypothetical protein
VRPPDPGPCPECRAPRKWQKDARKAAGGSWRSTCEHKLPRGGAAIHGPRVHVPPRDLGERTPRRPRQRPKAVATQRWKADPTVPVCPREGCWADYGTCEHGRRRQG